MIPDSARITVEWVPLVDIRHDDQVIDGAQVEFWTQQYQHAGTGHYAPPILNADRTVRDGRHRLLAHERTGRTAARCLIVHT